MFWLISNALAKACADSIAGRIPSFSVAALTHLVLLDLSHSHIEPGRSHANTHALVRSPDSLIQLKSNKAQ